MHTLSDSFGELTRYPSVLGGVASLLAFVRGYYQIGKLSEHPVVYITLRLVAIIVCLGLSILATYTHHLVRASGALLFMASVRLLSFWDVWGISTLKRHLSAEVFFHSTALLSLAASLDALVVGHFKNDLATAQRITITVTLTLAALVAVNKSSTRSRKLCTTITERASSLLQHLEALEELQSLNSTSDRLPNKRRECLDKLDSLDRALSTRLNTGYRRWGTPILSTGVLTQLHEEISDVISNPDRNSDEWTSCMHNLHAIKVACAHQIDVVA